MKKVLSLSGGGIRGILSARMLLEIEKLLPNPLYTYFDLIAGTSTGSIIAALLLTGKYTAKDCIDLYVKNAQKIFTKEFSVDGILRPKYSAIGIESCLQEYFGNMYVRDLLKPCLLPAYDTVQRKARFFASQDNDNSLVWEACRSSSAAPTYFPSYNVYVDGGVFSNAPGLCAISELGTTEDVFLLAIGTGQKEKSYVTRGWGELNWISPIIDILMSSSEEVTDYHLTKLLGENYIYLQPDLNGVSEAMDCVTPENIQALLDKPLNFDYDSVAKRISL